MDDAVEKELERGRHRSGSLVRGLLQKDGRAQSPCPRGLFISVRGHS